MGRRVKSTIRVSSGKGDEHPLVVSSPMIWLLGHDHTKQDFSTHTHTHPHIHKQAYIYTHTHTECTNLCRKDCQTKELRSAIKWLRPASFVS